MKVDEMMADMKVDGTRVVMAETNTRLSLDRVRGTPRDEQKSGKSCMKQDCDHKCEWQSSGALS